MEIDPAFEKFVWWRDSAGQSRRMVITRIMTMGSWDDIQKALGIFGEEEFRSILTDPPKGILDRRSWCFWNKRLGISPCLPYPENEAAWPACDELATGHSS